MVLYFLACLKVGGLVYTCIYVVFVQVVENTKELKKKMKDNIRRKSDLFKNGDLGSDKVWLSNILSHNFLWTIYIKPYFKIWVLHAWSTFLQVRFAVGGYKERYYKYKFSAEGPADIERKRKEVVCLIAMVLFSPFNKLLPSFHGVFVKATKTFDVI